MYNIESAWHQLNVRRRAGKVSFHFDMHRPNKKDKYSEKKRKEMALKIKKKRGSLFFFFFFLRE